MNLSSRICSITTSTAAILIACLLAAAGCATGGEPASRDNAAGSSPAAAHAVPERMAWWTDARFGMFIHWGLYAVPAGVWGDRTDYGEWIRDSAHIPVGEYDTLRATFNPVKFDADAIVLAAKNAGMKYIVITSKHHDGFALFDSKITDWDVMSTPFQRDIMKELSQACARHDIKMCWYHSIMDWHHPDYTPRRPWEKAQRPDTGADFDRYVAFMKGQLKELLTNYGPIGVLWFDGQWEGTWNDARGQDLENYVRSLQPDIIINNRVGRGGAMWGMRDDGTMPGDYATPEQEIPGSALRGVPWETCMTMNGHWGYNAADKNFKTSRDLIQKLADIASKGGNFLLNVGPTAEGLIPPESLDRLAAIGKWMKVNGESIYGTQAGPYDAPLAWGRVTQKSLAGGNTRLYLHVFDWPASGELIIPGLTNTASGARMLATGSPLKIDLRGEDLRLHLPSAAPDADDSVIVLDIVGTPDLNTPPTITASADEFVDEMPVTIATNRQNATIRYTTDGSEPGDSAQTSRSNGSMVAYTMWETTTITARCYRNGLPVSPSVKRTFTKVTPAPGQEIANLQRGLKYEQFNAAIKQVSELANHSPIKTGSCDGFDISSHPDHDNWAYRFTGFIRIPRDGMYRFGTRSDDGSQLSINGKVVVDNDKPHSVQDRFGHAALAEGWHAIEVVYFENTGGFELGVSWSGPGIEKQPIPAEILKHRP